MQVALRLAQHARGITSPNPMVGAVLVKGGKVIGRGWHRRAGLRARKSPPFTPCAGWVVCMTDGPSPSFLKLVPGRHDV